MKITNLDDVQFLTLLEQNLGRRWPKHWRARVWDLSPGPKYANIRGTCDPIKQREAIEKIRTHAAQVVAARLSN